MSKIGRQPILTNNVQVEVKGHDVVYKGAKSQGTYNLPEFLTPVLEDGKLFIKYDETKKDLREGKQFWGTSQSFTCKSY